MWPVLWCTLGIQHWNQVTLLLHQKQAKILSFNKSNYVCRSFNLWQAGVLGLQSNHLLKIFHSMRALLPGHFVLVAWSAHKFNKQITVLNSHPFLCNFYCINTVIFFMWHRVSLFLSWRKWEPRWILSGSFQVKVCWHKVDSSGLFRLEPIYPHERRG